MAPGRPAGRRGGGGGQSALPGDVGAGALRGGLRAADAGRAAGPGGALARAGGSDSGGPIAAMAIRAGRAGQRRGRRRGGAGAAVVGAVRPGDAGRLGRRRPARRPGKAGPPPAARPSARSGLVLIMAPWWVRNARVYGRFVPTALWIGASLYDGLNPDADGASDMTVPARSGDLAARRAGPGRRADPPRGRVRPRGSGARPRPGVVKLGRYWSPWPNAEGFRSSAVAVASAVVELPVLGLMALGLWDRRRDPRAWVLLAGPLLYFSALHMVFASSMRYRIPGEMPALGLAAIGWASLIGSGRGPVRAGNARGSDGASPYRERFPGKGSDAMRIGRRVAKVVFWGLVLCLSILGGGLWFAYTYVTDSANAAPLIRQYAVRSTCRARRSTRAGCEWLASSTR